MSYNFYDTWWERCLPPKYKEILAKAVSPGYFRSFREIYYKLYRGILIEGGRQKLWVDWNSDKVILMVSAKALDITGGLDSRYWQWVSREDSNFEQAAEAKDVEWFEVWQSIQCTILSPNTTYNVSFVLKIDRSIMPTAQSSFTFSFKPFDGESNDSAIFLDNFQKSVENGPSSTPFKNLQRGWTEFIVGKYKSKSDCTMNFEVCMKNTDTSFHKKGIIIDGVKLTPID